MFRDDEFSDEEESNLRKSLLYSVFFFMAEENKKVHDVSDQNFLTDQ